MSNEKEKRDITPEMQAIVTVERKRESIEGAIEKQKTKLLKNSCAFIQAMTPDNQESFLYRTVTALLDEKLSDCYNSPQGKLSIFRIVEETLSTGLELGKHAYAVPQPKKVGDRWIKLARYDIKREGYHVLMCTQNPIAKELDWGVVYADDECSIDSKTSEVTHKISIGKTRGPLIGVWVTALIIVEMKDGEAVTKRRTEYYPEDQILNIRDNHSESWKAFKEGKISTSPWQADPIRMYEKTALKGFCRPWVTNKDALSHAIYEEGSETFPTVDEEMPREEVAEAILNAVISEPAPESGRGTIEAEGHQPEEDIDEELNALSKDTDENEGTLF
jgi:recombinational DNA repair protein RecT